MALPRVHHRFCISPISITEFVRPTHDKRVGETFAVYCRELSIKSISVTTYKESGMKSTFNVVAVVGLVLGGVFGMVGTVVAEQNLRAAAWGIDSVGLIVATTLLTLKFFRAGNDFVASGFLVFAIGEAVILSGTAGTLESSVPSFGAGTALWCAALLLTSVPRTFALWVRAAGIIASILFAITSARIFWGQQVLPTTSPLPFFAYPFLVLTFVGWIWTLLKEA
jgi:hypothetical protein